MICQPARDISEADVGAEVEEGCDVPTVIGSLVSGP
jgi:hypothetical protein